VVAAVRRKQAATAAPANGANPNETIGSKRNRILVSNQ
jgi:hypothetical protein